MADFDAQKLCLAGLLVVELPLKTLRICDGGFVYWGTDKFESADEDFGSVESVEPMEEQVGDEAPSGRLTFLPVSTTAAATLSQPEYQGSPMRFYLARVNEQTGEIMGEPEQLADCLLDQTTLKIGKGYRKLDCEFVSVADRLFNIADGTVLSDRFHKSVWAGETGLANTTGVGKAVAWGTNAPPRGGTSGGRIGEGIRNFMDRIG